MKSKNWFWGIFFIVAAIFILANQLGYFTGVSLLSLVCTILLIPILINSIYHLNFAGVFFPIAILCIIYDDVWGITNLTPWTVLIIALFASIGFSFIFKPRAYHKYKGENFNEIINTPDGEVTSFTVHFGASIKYINTDCFKKANISCSFGAAKVYFDNANISPEGAEINLDVSFSGVELYIPKTWKVINNTSCSLGAVEEKNNIEVTGENTVKLNGKISFAGVEVRYV